MTASFVGDCICTINLVILIAGVAWLRGWIGNKGEPSPWWGRSQNDELDTQSGMGAGGLPGRTQKRAPSRASLAGFGLLRKNDPDFDVEGFYDRVREMFAHLQEAARTHDLTEAAHYIEGTAFKKLQKRVATHADDPVRLELTLERVTAVTVKRETDVDIVRVMVTAVSDAPGSDPIAGTPLVEGEAGRWYAQEYWTLVRAVGARTVPDASIYRCPNCGAPITTATRAECGYCATRLCDPARDWVVSDIDGQ